MIQLISSVTGHFKKYPSRGWVPNTVADDEVNASELRTQYLGHATTSFRISSFTLDCGRLNWLKDYHDGTLHSQIGLSYRAFLSQVGIVPKNRSVPAAGRPIADCKSIEISNRSTSPAAAQVPMLPDAADVAYRMINVNSFILLVLCLPLILLTRRFS